MRGWESAGPRMVLNPCLLRVSAVALEQVHEVRIAGGEVAVGKQAAQQLGGALHMEPAVAAGH